MIDVNGWGFIAVVTLAMVFGFIMGVMLMRDVCILQEREKEKAKP